MVKMRRRRFAWLKRRCRSAMKRWRAAAGMGVEPVGDGCEDGRERATNTSVSGRPRRHHFKSVVGEPARGGRKGREDGTEVML